MKQALLLVDLQHDYLSAAALQPAAGAIVDRAAVLLGQCRQRMIPVVHVRTTVQRNPDNRMPHWKSADKWICVAGTAGGEPPPVLRPRADEVVLHKQFFSAFGHPELEAILRSSGCDTLILAGVHLHGCIRATALDGYQRGFTIHIADDAVGSDDPVHAAITRRYLMQRSVRFDPVARILSPADSAPTAEPIEQTVSQARSAWKTWRRTEPSHRAEGLVRLAEKFEAESEALSQEIAREVGKPITMAMFEVRRSAALCRATAADLERPLEARSSPQARFRYEPLGTIAIITPWNNPLAIPVGKIAPALFYGNAVVWKPAPLSTNTSERAFALLKEAIPDAAISLCSGDRSVACALAEHPGIDGVSVSGSLAAGHALQEICARRCVPFQGELGGNNASIVWDDTDLPRAADGVARGAFGFAGQRCTANRRVIVAESIFDEFLKMLTHATAGLAWGDPLDPKTVIGPLISTAKRDEVDALLQRARDTGCRVIIPHEAQADRADLLARGAYLPPAIVICDDPKHEIVQEETFGPVLLLQRADDFDGAMELLNGIHQGLVAALFSDSPVRRQQFLSEARAGVLKLDRSTVDADAVSPLGGWKASGVGPAEHGPSDREFFCRVQTIYDG